LESFDSSEERYRGAVGAVFLRRLAFGKIDRIRTPIIAPCFAISNYGTT
jgi:hypothetical protein